MMTATANNQPAVINARWCNVCLLYKKKMEINQKLKKCSNCHLVQYCSNKHQKEDWPEHKDFCKAVQTVNKEHNASFIFEVNGAPTTAMEMQCKVFLVKHLLRNALGRNLHNHEILLTSFPNVCASCYSYRNLKPCQNCQGISYCSQLCKHRGDKWHEPQICYGLKLYYCLYKFEVKYPMMIEDNQKVQPIHMEFVNYAAELCGMDLMRAFFRTTLQRVSDEPYNSLEEYQTFCDAASLSCVASLCYAMEYTKLVLNAENFNCIVFVVGARFEPTFYFCEVQTKFFFLHYPYFTSLELYFIGPEVVDLVADEFVYHFVYKTRKVINHRYQGLFQDFCKENPDIKPTFIIGYNCGFTDQGCRISGLNVDLDETDTWSDGILHMLQYTDIQIILTAMSHFLSVSDFEWLNNVAKTSEVPIDIECLMPLHANPYYDPRPLPTLMCVANVRLLYRCAYIRSIRTQKHPL